MSLNSPVSVRKHPLWDLDVFDVWQFDCRVCDNGLEFADHATAIMWAQRHATKHRESACDTCGNSPYIKEDFQ